MAADTVHITWNGVELSNEGPFIVEMLTGWEDLPSPRVSDIPRANAHGSFDAPVWAGARTVVAEGHCNTPETRDALLQTLGRAIVHTAAPAELAIAFAGRELTAAARLTRSGRTLRDWGVGCFGFQIEWWAPDPFRYGEAVSTSTGLPDDPGGLQFPLFNTGGALQFGDLGVPGQVTLYNDGTAEAWPTFTVTGPVPTGFEIREVATGARVRWAGTVPGGIPVVIESRTGTASYGGAPGYEGHIVRREWAPVPPAGASTFQFLGLGSRDPAALLTASIRATYW